MGDTQDTTNGIGCVVFSLIIGVLLFGAFQSCSSSQEGTGGSGGGSGGAPSATEGPTSPLPGDALSPRGESGSGGGGQPQPLPPAAAPPPAPPPPPPPLPPSEPATREEIEQFIADCNRRVSSWKHDAKMTWPEVIDLEINHSKTYLAIVDLAGRVAEIPNATATSGTISVKCYVTATLEGPQGGELRIDDSDGSSNTRALVPTTRAQWSWEVVGIKPGNHELRLLVEPALMLGETYTYEGDPSLQQVVFITRVNVGASFIYLVSQWFSENWPLVTAVAGTVGLSIFAAIKWFGELRQLVSVTFGRRWRRSQPEPQPAAEEQSRENV